MLNVSYVNRIGYYTEQQGANKFKFWFCHANCLCAIMYFYDRQEEDGTKTPMAQVHGFFGDNLHAKNCIKDGFFNNCSNFHFYAKELNKDINSPLWRMIKEMTANGIKVTIE